MVFGMRVADGVEFVKGAVECVKRVRVSSVKACMSVKSCVQCAVRVPCLE